MSVSILEALQCANINLDNMRSIGMLLLPLVKEQMNNAVVLIEKGYPLKTQVKPLLERFGDVENVPEYDSTSTS